MQRIAKCQKPQKAGTTQTSAKAETMKTKFLGAPQRQVRTGCASTYCCLRASTFVGGGGGGKSSAPARAGISTSPPGCLSPQLPAAQAMQQPTPPQIARAIMRIRKTQVMIQEGDSMCVIACKGSTEPTGVDPAWAAQQIAVRTTTSWRQLCVKLGGTARGRSEGQPRLRTTRCAVSIVDGQRQRIAFAH